MSQRHHRKARQRAMKYRRWVAIKHPILGRTRYQPFGGRNFDRVWIDDIGVHDHTADALAYMLQGFAEGMAWSRITPIEGPVPLKVEVIRPRPFIDLPTWPAPWVGADFATEPDRNGYWCVVCGRLLPNDDGVIVHDDVIHPDTMTFDEEDNPQ